MRQLRWLLIALGACAQPAPAPLEATRPDRLQIARLLEAAFVEVETDQLERALRICNEILRLDPVQRTATELMWRVSEAMSSLAARELLHDTLKRWQCDMDRDGGPILPGEDVVYAEWLARHVCVDPGCTHLSRARIDRHLTPKFRSTLRDALVFLGDYGAISIVLDDSARSHAEEPVSIPPERRLGDVLGAICRGLGLRWAIDFEQGEIVIITVSRRRAIRDRLEALSFGG
jgi:hypothetical protein